MRPAALGSRRRLTSDAARHFSENPEIARNSLQCQVRDGDSLYGSLTMVCYDEEKAAALLPQHGTVEYTCSRRVFKAVVVGSVR